MSPGLDQQWDTATALFPSLADITPVSSIASALAPRTLVEPNLHSSCRPSIPARAFLPSKRVISDQLSPPSKQPIPFRVRSRETNLINKSWSLARRSWPTPWVYGPWPESMQAVEERSHDRDHQVDRVVAWIFHRGRSMANLKILEDTSHVPTHKIVSVNRRVKSEIRRLLVCPSVCPAGSREFSAPRQGQGRRALFPPTRKLCRIPCTHQHQ